MALEASATEWLWFNCIDHPQRTYSPSGHEGMQPNVCADVDKVAALREEPFQHREHVGLVSPLEEDEGLNEVPGVQVHLEARADSEALKSRAVQRDQGALKP